MRQCGDAAATGVVAGVGGCGGADPERMPPSSCCAERRGERRWRGGPRLGSPRACTSIQALQRRRGWWLALLLTLMYTICSAQQLSESASAETSPDLDTEKFDGGPDPFHKTSWWDTYIVATCVVIIIILAVLFKCFSRSFASPYARDISRAGGDEDETRALAKARASISDENEAASRKLAERLHQQEIDQIAQYYPATMPEPEPEPEPEPAFSYLG